MRGVSSVHMGGHKFTTVSTRMRRKLYRTEQRRTAPNRAEPRTQPVETEGIAVASSSKSCDKPLGNCVDILRAWICGGSCRKYTNKPKNTPRGQNLRPQTTELSTSDNEHVCSDRWPTRAESAVVADVTSPVI